MFSGHSIGLSDHPHHIFDVGTEDHHVKEARKYIQGHLEAGRSWGIQEPIFRVKERCKPLDGL